MAELVWTPRAYADLKAIGAHGLRAIRFTVSDEAPESEIEIETELVRVAAKGSEAVSA